MGSETKDFTNHVDPAWRASVKRRPMALSEVAAEVEERVARTEELKATGRLEDPQSRERAEVERLVGECQVLDREVPVQQHPGHPRGDGAGRSGQAIPRGGSLYEAVKRAGFDPVDRNRVQVSPGPALFGAVTVTSPIDTLAPYRRRDTVRLGLDQRHIYPALKSVGLSATDTAVDYFQVTARTLANPDTMRRALTATTAKPESAVTVELKHVTLYQVAHVISDIPLITFRQPAIRNVIDGELRLGLNEALDEMVSDEIAATTIPSGGAVGGSLASRIRKAVKVVQDAGYTPDVLAINSQGSLDLDLELLALNNSSGVSPSWDLQVRSQSGSAGAGSSSTRAPSGRSTRVRSSSRRTSRTTARPTRCACGLS